MVTHTTPLVGKKFFELSDLAYHLREFDHLVHE